MARQIKVSKRLTKLMPEITDLFQYPTNGLTIDLYNQLISRLESIRY